ncbi:MAG: hypothetical protein PHZ03_01030 [Syntrophomonas sp.]|nr:hypothetical protein [Syntrophomonas sp.]
MMTMTVREIAEFPQEDSSPKLIWYAVTCARSKNNITQAEDEQQAKLNVCKFWGISPSDCWLGISALTARRITINYKGHILTNTADVIGYEKLNDSHKKLFEEFLNNYWAVWELPENHLPAKIKYVKGKIPYLRVDFAKGGWLHILSPHEWF